MDLTALLNTITAAMLLGAGKMLLDIKTTQVLHGEKLKYHDKRIEGLEEKPSCPHV